MKGSIPIAAACVAALFCGCVQEKVEKKEQKFVAGSLPLPEYAPLERYKLAINLEGSRELVAGSNGTLRFSICNTDSVPVKIPEWYVNEPENIQLFCQSWFPEMEKPDENAWVPIEYEKTPEQLKQPDFRFPLELAPENRVYIDRDLRIVRVLKVSPGNERRFFVKAKLNLHSVNVESPVFAISVHSKEDEAKLEKARQKKTTTTTTATHQ
jgi:hypothetical protein